MRATPRDISRSICLFFLERRNRKQIRRQTITKKRIICWCHPFFFRYINFSQILAIKKLFPRANIQPVRGTFQECLDYIRKDGRYHSIAFVPKERYIQYVLNDNKLAQLALEGDITISRLEDRITNLETKLDKLILLISQKKILNTLHHDESVL